MTKQVEAIYENGVLRLLEPLTLDEHQHVIVTVSSDEDPLASIIDHAFLERARKEVQAMNYIPSLEEVRKILSKIPGSLSQDIGTERKDRF